jgi:preprotein translocase subunit YajC
MLISQVWAQDVGAGAGANPEAGILSLVPFLLIALVFYFLLIRPQQKRMKQHTMMVNSLERGNIIETNGGLVGRVVQATQPDKIDVEFSKGFVIPVKRRAVVAVEKSDSFKEDSDLSKSENQDQPSKSKRKKKNIKKDDPPLALEDNSSQDDSLQDAEKVNNEGA